MGFSTLDTWRSKVFTLGKGGENVGCCSGLRWVLVGSLRHGIFEIVV